MKVEPNESAASSDDVTEVASLDLDESPTNVFKTKLSINILYDTIDGVKKNPRIDKPGFSLEGLEFQFGISTFDNDRFPYALALELHESSKNRLARGYEISVRYEDVMTFSDEGHIERDESKKDFGMLALTELAFSAAVTRFELVVEMKFEDIFPHRLQYVNAEVAKENMNDCKLILVDDENKVVYVNKHILASRSPFFKTLLFGRGKKKVIKLNGVKLTDFLEYLYCCYPIPIRPFAFKRLEALLGLAGRFQNHALKVEIETYLTEKKGNTSKEKEKILIWADTYDMTALFRNILKTMSEAELKKIASKTYKNFKKENLELLVSCFICHSC